MGQAAQMVVAAFKAACEVRPVAQPTVQAGHEGEEGEYAGHVHAPGLGIFAVSALVVHSLLDGVAIGAGFQAGSTVGAFVAIAVLSHDFADGFNTYTITSLYGNDRRRALALLVADALAPVTSAAITLLVTIPQEILERSGCSTRSPVVCDDDLLQGREAIFLSTFVMVRHNRADE